MYKEIIDNIKPEMDKVINFLERELQKIRTGQVSTSLIEDIMVDCFDEKLPLKQLAAISVTENRKIIIQPWDKSYLEFIEKAISKSSINMAPIIDKDTIRLTPPLMSEEYRKNLLKLISEKQEEAKKTIRRWREKAWNETQEGFKNKKIREDDKYKAKDELQDLVNKHNEKIDKVVGNKKKEITE